MLEHTVRIGTRLRCRTFLNTVHSAMKLFCAPLVSRLKTFMATSLSSSTSFPWYTELYLPRPIRLDTEKPSVALARSLKEIIGNCVSNDCRDIDLLLCFPLQSNKPNMTIASEIILAIGITTLSTIGSLCLVEFIGVIGQASTCNSDAPPQSP